MFIRYAPLLKERGAVVFVLTQTRLIRMVARCPGVDMALDGTSRPAPERFPRPVDEPAGPPRDDAGDGPGPRALPAGRVDRRRTLAQALAAALGADTAAGADRAATGRRRSGGRPLLVGVAWQGSPTNPMDHWRSFPLASWRRSPTCPGVRLVNLQVVDGLDQVRALDGRFPIVELESRRPREFYDSAAIITLLDLVITPDTAVAHMAGGLGVPVWLAISTRGRMAMDDRARG